MVQMTIEMPEGVLAALHTDPVSFAKELRLVAAVKWYELRYVAEVFYIAGDVVADALRTVGETWPLHA